MQSRLLADLSKACLVLLFAQTMLSCHKNVSGPTSKPLDLPAGSAPVIAAADAFSVDIFRTMLQYDTSSANKLISPLSIYTALSMVYNGANTSTKDSMTKTLSLTGIPTAGLNSVSKALIEQMPDEDSKVQLSIANSIWYDTRHPAPAPTFLSTIHDSYDATMSALDFTNPTSVTTINSWVAQHTNNKIKTIIKSLTPDDLMVLVNAVYFNGSWKYAFKTSDTHNDNFYRKDGSITSVPFMNQQIATRTYTGPSFKMVELPYGTGNAFNMYVLMPVNTTQSLNSFAASLDQTALTSALSGLDSTKIQLSMPKWEYSYNIDNMAPNLSSLGMGIAFSDGADFSLMYPSVGAKISKVIHKTYVKVSEEGTEAAAVTGVVMITATVGPPNIPLVKLDHPFVYLIAEKQTGSIFFMGLLNDPGSN